MPTSPEVDRDDLPGPPDGPERPDWRESLRADPLGLTRHFDYGGSGEASRGDASRGDASRGEEPRVDGSGNGRAHGNAAPRDERRNESAWSVLRPIGVLAAALLIGFLAGVGETVVLIVAFLACIVLHELGHFLMAKWGRIKVTEFYVGFGPRLWFVRRGETDYGVRALPLGGYCRIIGMHNLEDVDPADEARTYRQAPLLRRLSVAVAGSAMHFLIALCLLFALFFWAGDSGFYLTKLPANQPIVAIDALHSAGSKGGRQHSPAEDAGFKVGDRIVAIDGRRFPTYDAQRNYIRGQSGRRLAVTVERGGRTEVLHPVPVNLLTVLAASAPIVSVGPAAPANGGPHLKVGDRIDSIDGRSFPNFEQLRRFVESRPDQKLPVVVRRDGHRVDLGAIGLNLAHLRIAGPNGTPQQVAKPDGFLGIESSTVIHSSFGQSLSATGGAFVHVSALTLHAFGRLLTLGGITTYFHALTDRSVADSAADQVRFSSPVGVVRLFHQASSTGAATQLWLLAVINISVGLFNLIPLLPLDGGHVAIALYEGVRSRRGRRYHADVAKLLPLLYLTLAALGLLALSSLFLDVRDLSG